MFRLRRSQVLGLLQSIKQEAALGVLRGSCVFEVRVFRAFWLCFSGQEVEKCSVQV